MNRMRKVPERIYLLSYDAAEQEFACSSQRVDQYNTEYIRKDVYDKAQARIKELEEALRFYAEGKHNKTIFHTEYLDTETVIENGAIARNALEKESKVCAERK